VVFFDPGVSFHFMLFYHSGHKLLFFLTTDFSFFREGFLLSHEVPDGNDALIIIQEQACL
jgi:hypothetical protein